MTLPGTEVIIRDEPVAGFPAQDTGTLFAVGLTESGPADRPVTIRSIGSFVQHFGGRVAYGTLYDALDVFFREGGGIAHVIRVVGPDAAASTIDIPDAAAGDSLTVTAKGPGAGGDNLDVVISDGGGGAGTYRIAVEIDGSTLESSQDMTTTDQAVGWAERSSYVNIEATGEEIPDTGSYSLAGGDDDRAAITTQSWVDALALATRDWGPGQVIAPMQTSAEVHGALIDHAAALRRVVLLDAEEDATAADLRAAALALRDSVDPQGLRFAALFAPWATLPGVAIGTSRSVPYSAVEAGMIARSDSRGNTPNIPAAGQNGVSRYAVGLSSAPFTATDYEELNDVGVNVARLIRGTVRTYGYRTLANPVSDPRWVELSGTRVVMKVIAEADQVAETYLFSQMDGQGRKLSQFAGDLVAICAEQYEAGALYGSTPQEAFNVDVGPAVNTPETIAARELHAVIELRTSPFAERVVIELVRRSVTESI